MTILLPTKKSIDQEQVLPLVPIRNLVPFPDAEIQLIFGRPKSTAALFYGSEKKEKLVMVVAQRDPRIDDPKPKVFPRLKAFFTSRERCPANNFVSSSSSNISGKGITFT